MQERFLSYTKLGRQILRRTVEKQLRKGRARFYEAPREILRLALLGIARLPDAMDPLCR